MSKASLASSTVAFIPIHLGNMWFGIKNFDNLFTSFEQFDRVLLYVKKRSKKIHKNQLRALEGVFLYNCKVLFIPNYILPLSSFELEAGM